LRKQKNISSFRNATIEFLSTFAKPLRRLFSQHLSRRPPYSTGKTAFLVRLLRLKIRLGMHIAIAFAHGKRFAMGLLFSAFLALKPSRDGHSPEPVAPAPFSISPCSV
jgi:hypothetical protein